jgi:hypothetical protein
VDRQQDTSGDYGYDLVHEATSRRPAPATGTDHRTEGAPAAADAQPGMGEDLGYDEAHDF